MKSICTPTEEGDWYSVALCSQGEDGVDEGLISSFPVRTKLDGSLEVVSGLELDAFSQKKLELSVQELREEKAAVEHLLV